MHIHKYYIIYVNALLIHNINFIFQKYVYIL
jgi:hypothetical protein